LPDGVRGEPSLVMIKATRVICIVDGNGHYDSCGPSTTHFEVLGAEIPEMQLRRFVAKKAPHRVL
jgi:hypothetical protein